MLYAVVGIAKTPVALGREWGHVTHAEVHAALSAAQASSEVVEDVLAMPDDVGIHVVPGGEDDGQEA